MLPFARRLFLTTRALGTFTTAAMRSNAKAFHNHPSDLSEGEQNIYAKLTAKFTPSQLRVQDVSGGCGTFYAITISSPAFQGLSTLKQHKLVTDTLKLEIAGIHGLQQLIHDLDKNQYPVGSWTFTSNVKGPSLKAGND